MGDYKEFAIKKPKLTIPKQVKYMDENCGIKFEICTKEDAVKFLEESTYFFKVKAFAKVFPKEKDSNKYQNLDFAYLRELSTLDMYLRKEILNIALDFEHYLKVWLIKDLSQREEEDGYNIVEQFFKTHPEEKDQIESKAKSSVCKDLSEALQNKGYAMWNLVEILSFGGLIKLYDLYSTKYNVKIEAHDLLLSIKCIRNAAAHNNCLLNSLRQPYSKEIKGTKCLATYLSTIPGMGRKMINSKLENPVSHDFAALMMGYDKIVTSNSAKIATYSRLKDFFDKKLTRKAIYFKNNEIISSYYTFGKKIVDFLYKNAYTIIDEQKP